ncbi:MAG: LysM peptidoglycan-binding domain-containing protein, partial [Clostridia bacterium]|nr:LysM peptidoglycan-binding domain-containing protein [Clostridia bacterium]
RFATPTGAGIEVRFAIDFSWTAQMPRRASGVSDMRLDESAPRNTANQPSIVLRMVGDGERLWDIAKSYGTTMEEIVRANALTEEVPPMGQLLLIPKKR